MIYLILLLFLISVYRYHFLIPLFILFLLISYFYSIGSTNIFMEPFVANMENDMKNDGDDQQTVEGFERPEMGFPSGYFKIRSRFNEKCLDVNGGSSNQGTRAIVWDCHDGLHQQWYVDGLGRLKNRLSNRCLEISGSQETNGAAIQIGDCHGGKNQQWFVDSVGHIKSRLNNFNLTFNERDQVQTWPVYMWSNYNSLSQKWYFERIEQPKQVVRLITTFDGLHDQRIEIPNSRLNPSNNYTYYFWLRMTDLKYHLGQWKQLLHKGDVNANVRSPGIWIHPNEAKFHFRVSTTSNNNEGCDPQYIIPINQWIHVAYVLEDNTISSYINAQLIRKCVLQGTPNNNADNIYVGSNGFGGQLRNIEYANYSMNTKEIANRMNSTQPEQKCRQVLPVTIVPNNILKNFDLKNGWIPRNIDNLTFDEMCPPNGMGGQTLSMNLKQGQSFYHSSINNANLRPNIAYRFSL